MYMYMYVYMYIYICVCQHTHVYVSSMRLCVSSWAGPQQGACSGQPLNITRSTCYRQFVVHRMRCIYKAL